MRCLKKLLHNESDEFEVRCCRYRILLSQSRIIVLNVVYRRRVAAHFHYFPSRYGVRTYCDQSVCMSVCMSHFGYEHDVRLSVCRWWIVIMI